MHNKPSINNPLPSFIRRGYEGSKRKMKIGFDLHGVIDTQTGAFRKLMQALIDQGWEVHIITGATWERERPTLKKLRIPFTHFFSIIDHHTAIGTKVVWVDDDNPNIDPHLWNETKAIYCHVHRVTMHFDDSDIYRLFFKTPYIRFFSNDSDRIKKIHITSPEPQPARKNQKKRLKKY